MGLLFTLFILWVVDIKLPRLRNSLILSAEQDNSNSLIWFSNLNLGTNLLLENVPSPSINPANQNLVLLILLLIELGIHLPCAEQNTFHIFKTFNYF